MSKDEGKKPAAKKPAAKPPIAKKPAAKKPAAKKPAAKKPAAKKPAAKKPAAKAAAANAAAAKAPAAKKATAKAPTAKKPAAKKPTASAAPATVSPSDQAALAARVDAAWTKLEAWLGKNATPVAERMKKAKGSTAAEIAKAEAAFGAAAPWPADVRAHFARYGAVSGAVFYEYEALTLQRAVASGRGFDKLVDDGTFGKFTPHELDPGPKKIRFTWWHRGWLPIAQDGGGNLLCVDLDPDTKGRFGQIINWEMHGGPVGPVSGSLAEHLEKYAKTLASGKLTYDVDSGIFM